MESVDTRLAAPIYVKILLTMGTAAVNILEAKDTSETAPIYVKVLLLHLKICANIRKSICNDNGMTIGTGAVNKMKAIDIG